MSTATLSNLLEFLYGTLTPSNMQWLGEQLIEHARNEEEKLRPYTMEEINAMIDEAEAEIAAGKGTSHEEVMREWDEEIARMEQEELEMAEAV
jgi:hypothetical protein